MFDNKNEYLFYKKFAIIFCKENNLDVDDLESQSDEVKKLYDSYPNWKDIDDFKAIIENVRKNKLKKDKVV